MKKSVGIVVGVLIAALFVAFGVLMQKQSKPKPDAVSVQKLPQAEPKPPEPCPSDELLSQETLPKDAPLSRTWKIVRSEVTESDYCDGELTIKLPNNGAKVFTDNHLGEGTKVYRVKDFYPDQNMLLLQVTYYESQGLQIVSTKDGSVEELNCDFPVFSPSKRFLFSNCLSLYSEGPQMGFGVWSVEDGKVTQVFKTESWAALDVSWKDESTIQFTQVNPTLKDDDRFDVRLGMSLVKKDTGWQVEQPAGEIQSKPRVVARIGCHDSDILDDQLHHVRGLAEALKKHDISVIEQTVYGCDTLFIRNSEILYIYQVMTDSDLYDMARKFFQLPDPPATE